MVAFAEQPDDDPEALAAAVPYIMRLIAAMPDDLREQVEDWLNTEDDPNVDPTRQFESS